MSDNKPTLDPTVAARASFSLCSPETQVLRLLSEDEITLNKAREWLREWIIEGVPGPLPKCNRED